MSAQVLEAVEELSPDVIKALCKQHDSRYLDNICMSAQVLEAVEELSPDVIKALCKQHDSRYLDNICMSAQVLEAVEMVNNTTSINWLTQQINDDINQLFLRGVKPDVTDCPNDEAKTLRKEK